MIFELDMFLTTALAVIVLILGSKIKDKVQILQRFSIPTPVVGGIFFTLIVLIGYVTETFTVNMSMTLSDFFMLMFYTSIGFTASIPILKKGGVDTIKFLILSSILVVIQNAAGVFGAKALGVDPLVGLATGSIPMTGGHGTSAVFAPELAKLGLVGADTIALAAATFGLVSGALLGGPVGTYLIEKRVKNRNEKTDTTTAVIDFEGEFKNEVSVKGYEESMFLMLIAMALGTIISKLLGKTGLTFPASVGGMLASALIVNLNNKENRFRIHHTELDMIGNTSLLIFLALSMMKLKLWEIADLAGPMLALLFMQVIIMAIFGIFIVFKVMGSDYEAAITTSGHCGFGLGAVPTAMANMQTLTAKYGVAPKSFFIVPLVGSLFINIINSFVITIFMNIAVNI
jgi:ESS family glutamate:Na+ symporter